MGFIDLVLGPVFFILIYLWAKSTSDKFNDVFLKKHFVNGLIFKLVGAIGASIVYWYVYGGGDSINYFNRSLRGHQILSQDFSAGIKLLIFGVNENDYTSYMYANSLQAQELSSFMVVRILTFINIFTFDSYLSSSFIFALLSFYGIWKAFRLFIELYPNYSDKIAIAFLYVPSVIFWGSGIFKDNITFGFLCLLTVALYNITIRGRKIISSILVVIASIYVIGIIKSYILMAFLPSFGIWLFLEYRKKITSSVLRTASTPFFIGLSLIAGVFMLQTLGKTFSKFSVENVEEKAAGMQRWHTKRGVMKGEEGSGSSSYSLGDGVDFTPVGIARKAPLAIIVAIYRPFLWEVRNPIMLLSAFESLALLFFTLKLLPFFLRSPGRTLSILGDNPPLVFSIVFSLIFAFSVGFTSYNFGALSRYRIPFLPFYFVFISILYEKLVVANQIIKK